MFKDYFGESFLFSKTNQNWKAKRTAIAHAFYKDRMKTMLDVLKEKIEEAFLRWIEDMSQSQGKNQTIVDISKEFELIFAKNIIHIAFGEDINE